MALVRPALLRIEGFPAVHAFTLRSGGTSGGRYASLNLGDAVGDEPDRVAVNRRLVARELEVRMGNARLLTHVHGDRVVDAGEMRAAGVESPEADAQVSVDPRDLLVISVADCIPILFFDSVTGAAAAAHCGWKGTSLGLAGEVVRQLGIRFGVRPADLWVAIGPGIAGECYQVGEEVVARFATAGFPNSLWWPDDQSRYRLDLAAANRFVLEAAGVEPERIMRERSCTHCEPDRFFSYRREGTTGRHWAVVRPAAVGTMGDAASTRDHAAPPRA